MFEFDLQLFGGVVDSIFGGGGGQSQSSTSSYQPSEQELNLMNKVVDNADLAQPGIKTMLNQFNSGVQSDYFNSLLNRANGIVDNGMNAANNSANGVLGAQYMSNLQDAYNQLSKNAIGNTIASAAGRGVLNGSAANKAINNASASLNNAIIQNYGNALGQQSQLGLAAAGSTGNFYAPYGNLANLAGQQQQTYISGPLGALHGTGTTTSESTMDDGSSGLGNLFQMGLGAYTGALAKKWV